MYDFSGKVVLITGAAGNLGEATASAFAAAGARLVLTDIDEERLLSLYGEADDRLPLEVDLTKERSVQAMLGQVMQRFSQIDILANIAGGFRVGPLLQETETATWDFVMDLNARSVFNMCRAIVPHMLKRGGGRIVNVSARAAVQAKGRMAPYCASKAAVLTLTESLAVENRHTGINVNCILPGTVDTPQNRASMPDADFSTWVTAAELADVILFLASDAARAVNGAAIPVYGQS